jgi:hypothetical protein
MAPDANDMPEDVRTDYHLMVDLVVRASDSPEFEKRVREFLLAGGFCRIDPAVDRKTLVLAIRTVEPFTYKSSQTTGGTLVSRDDRFAAKSEKEKLLHRYVHIWKTPNLTNLDLARIMRLSGDDKAYMDIDALVLDEIQDFVVRVGFEEGRGLLAPEPDGQYVVRAKRRFASADLGPYLFKIGIFFPALKQQNIQSLGLYQNATGPLNTVSEFWLTNDSNPTADRLAGAALEKLGDGKLFADLAKFYTTKQKRDQRETFRSYLPSFVFRAQARVCEGLREVQGLNTRGQTVPA